MTRGAPRVVMTGRRGPKGDVGPSGPETGRFGVHGLAITDWNDAVDNGYYTSSGAANQPQAGAFFGHVYSSADEWVVQMVSINGASKDLRTWLRAKVDGAWSTWKEFGFFNGYLTPIESEHGFSHEGGKHRMVTNDGAGNWQIRIGHDYGVSNAGLYTSRETGYAGQIQFNQSLGHMGLGPITASSITEDTTFTADLSGYLNIYPTSINFGGNKMMHLGNDGAGSLFDADLLDGQHASYFQVASDISIKDDIRDLEYVTDKLMHVKIHRYRITDDEWKHVPEIGVIAQEIEEVFPEFVYENGGKKLVHYGPLCSVLFQGFQELVKRVEELEGKLNAQ